MSWTITPQTKVPVDPQYGSVSLLLHGNGTNGSTTITDNSPSPKTVTAFGNAQISTAQSKFGGSSIFMSTAGSNLSIARNPNLVPIGDWTYECWFWLNSTSDPSFGQSFYGNWGSVDSTANDLDIRKSGNTLYLYCRNLSNSLITTINASYSFVAQRWDHLAITRQGNTYRFFFNGVLTNTITDSTPVFDGTAPITVGLESVNLSQFGGYFDELRVTSGVARYTSNFTPPAAPFPDI